MSKKHSVQLAEIVPDDPDDTVIGLNQQDLIALSPYLGRNINNKDDLLIAISNLSTVNCEGVEIKLEPGLLQRLKSRCIRQAFPEFLQRTIREQLHSFVGW